MNKNLSLLLLLAAVVGMIVSSPAATSITIASTDEGSGEDGGESDESESEPEPEPEEQEQETDPDTDQDAPEPEPEPEPPGVPAEPIPIPAPIPSPPQPIVPETKTCPDGSIIAQDETCPPVAEPVPPIEICIPEDLDCDGEIDEGFIPQPIPEPEPDPNPPDDSCLFDPTLPQCAVNEDLPGNGCPEGFNRNADDQCVPEHPNGCPEGYHSHEDDETGKCIPDDVPCEEGYVRDPDFPTCNDKDRVCEEHPNADVCKPIVEPLPPECPPGYEFDDGVCTKEIVIEIIKNINIHKTIHNTQDFPEVDVIGLSVKDTGEAMVCIMNIDNDWVQCQEFGISNDRINENIWRVIETDQDKDYDNANTGSDDVDDAIDAIKSQDFSELDDLDNHDFDVDQAALAINPQGDGLICLIEDDRNEGTALCEPFKVSNEAISGQITEITEIDS